jgi:CubicO group peptidase (beta-lactamase class C family)
MPEIHGTVLPGFAGVADAFRQNFTEWDEGGASLAVYRHGQPVVDLWGGIDPVSTRPWKRDSTTVVFSVTKTAAAVVLLRLVERGLVDLDAPVARYWSEFGRAGKHLLTIRDVLSHLVALPELGTRDAEAFLDDEGMAASLAAAAPQFEPRANWVYHPLSFGYLVGEIVRRVTGQSVGTAFARDVAGPLGLDYWIGLPPSADASFRPGHYDEPPVLDAIPSEVLSGLSPALQALLRSTDELHEIVVRQPGSPPGAELMNQRRFRAAEIAAVSGVTNARSLARFYAACASPMGREPLLSSAMLSELMRSQTTGTTPLTGPERLGQTRQKQFGLGFDLPNSVTPMFGEGSFGHSGIGGRLGFAHPESGIALGYVSTKMYWFPEGADRRWEPIVAALRESL